MLFLTLGILQSQFTEKGFKKTEHFEHSVVLLFLLFTLNRQQQQQGGGGKEEESEERGEEEEKEEEREERGEEEEKEEGGGKEGEELYIHVLALKYRIPLHCFSTTNIKCRNHTWAFRG